MQKFFDYNTKMIDDTDIELKPTHIPILTNKILKDVLTRPPEGVDKLERQKVGRTAYKLDVYKDKTDAKIIDL